MCRREAVIGHGTPAMPPPLQATDLHKSLRVDPGPQGRRPRGRRGRARRAARPQRRRQVDAGEDRLRARPRHGGEAAVAAPAPARRGAARVSATWPSSSASPAGRPPTRCSTCTSGSRARDGGAAERARAARARRPRRRGRAPGRDDVQGHAAAARASPRRWSAPAVLLLDEPTSALDPGGRRTVRELLEELRAPRRRRPAQLAPASRGRARLRPRRHPRRGEVVAAGRPRTCHGRAASRSTPAPGTAPSRTRGREDVPRIVPSSSPPASEVYGVRVLRRTLEDAYLEAVVRRAG